MEPLATHARALAAALATGDGASLDKLLAGAKGGSGGARMRLPLSLSPPPLPARPTRRSQA